MAQSKRNEVAAGVFILVALAALTVVLIVAGDWASLTRPVQLVHVEFAKAPGIRVGSDVTLGGQPIGAVRAVELRQDVEPPDTGQNPVHYYSFVLALEIPDDIVVSRDAMITIDAPLIGEGASVNIQTLGTGEPATDTAEKPIEGRKQLAMAGAAEALGIGDAQRERIREIIDNLAEMTAALKADVPALTENLKETSGDAREIVADAKQRLPSILEDAEASTAKLKSASTTLDELLGENRERISTSADNLAEMTSSARESVAHLLENLDQTVARVRTLVEANQTNVHAMVVNMRQMSEELEAASEEIRRAPWRLLHRPDKGESDTLNVFDAARSYATAASELRSLTDTLDSLARLRADGVEVDPKVLDALTEQVRTSLDRYQKAEEALWKEFGAIDP